MHKGQAVRTFVEEQQAKGIVFGGDDLGDIEAFEAVRDLRDEGLPGLVICSASTEQPDLVELADLVVDGPAGVVEALAGLAARPLTVTPSRRADSTSWTRCAHRETPA